MIKAFRSSILLLYIIGALLLLINVTVIAAVCLPVPVLWAIPAISNCTSTPSTCLDVTWARCCHLRHYRRSRCQCRSGFSPEVSGAGSRPSSEDCPPSSAASSLSCSSPGILTCSTSSLSSSCSLTSTSASAASAPSHQDSDSGSGIFSASSGNEI